jgi:hypothetical protein
MREPPLRVGETQSVSIRPHNKAPSVVAMGVGEPFTSALRVECSHAASTPSGFTEIASDDFPILYLGWILSFLFFT